MTTIDADIIGVTVGPTRRPLLDRVELTFDGPGLRIISGPSGSGKTTLLHLLAGLLDVPEGSRASINGAPAVQFDRRRVIPQRPNLMTHRTLLDNVALPLQLAGSTDTSRAGFVMEHLGLKAVGNSLARDASGGEQARTVIAREVALGDTDSVFFTDEPTATLDQASRRQVYDTLAEIALEVPVLVVAHDHDAARYAQETITIQDRTALHTRLGRRARPELA